MKDMTVVFNGHGVMAKNVQMKQRASDGKWELFGSVPLWEEKYYTPNFDTGRSVLVVPTRYITLGVYDYEVEIANGTNQ